MARLKVEGYQWMGGNAERGEAEVLKLCPSVHCFQLTDMPWP